MDIIVELRWAGAQDARAHRLAISAEPGTPGISVAREIRTFLGIDAELSIRGTDVSSMRFAEPPLLDGVTITLGTPDSPADRKRRTEDGARASPDGGAGHRIGREQENPGSPRLTVVSGAGCGTELMVSRGSQWLAPVHGVPSVMPHHPGHHAAEIVMDHSGVRIMPGSLSLREGDRLRCGDSWLELSTPASDRSARHRVHWTAASEHHDSPADIITVHRASGQGARWGLVIGLLPLLLGVVITVITGMWFFMLFSALGAVVAIVSWGVGRAVRGRERTRVTAALERDLVRCAEAAPSAAEIVSRLRRLEHGAALALPTRREPVSDRRERWVRLGHAGRVAAVNVGEGPSAVPAEHRRAPVLVNLARVHHLTVHVPSRLRSEVINALAVQLLTGPGACRHLVLDPAVPWQAPQLSGLRVLPAHQQNSITGPALEIYTARTAAQIPSSPERIRLVVSVAGDPIDAGHGGAVLTWEATAILVCAVPDTVPGFDAGAGRDALALHLDSVSTEVFTRAMRQWSWLQSALPALQSGSELPHSVGSHAILPEPAQIPGLWAGSARRGTLTSPIGLSRHGTESIGLGDEHPHVLIVGTTGCGKSELLRTLVASLACRFPPERLEFLLVDFKGGAGLSPLTGLPHRSTLLTDLTPEDVRRALEFLRAELRRRERILSQHRVPDFRYLLSGTPVDEPLPFRELVVVVDEVKMLVDAFTSAGEELAKVATVGRSLGIHLVLATQRPQGAIPADVRANVTQSLCLRVRTEQDSTDVLGRPVAATIASDTPGRAFRDTGHGKPVEVQTAILTDCASPPVSEIRIRIPGTDGPAHPGPPPRPADTAEAGVARVVGHVAAAHRLSRSLSPTAGALDDTRPHADAAVRPVPAPLPERARPIRHEPGAVDLGPAENSAEHWTGRASWRPLVDGTLFLMGQSTHTSVALLSVLEQLVPGHSPSSERHVPAVYVITTSTTIHEPARSWCEHGLLHGVAHTQDVFTVKQLLDRVAEGSQRFQSAHRGEPDPKNPPAVLLIEDWDRCCALLRSSPWPHLEEDLLALATSGERSGIATVLSGDRALSVGRASSAGRTRVYFPADQTAESLLQWPRLPAVTAIPQRGVLQGAAANRSVPTAASGAQNPGTVIQLPGPSNSTPGMDGRPPHSPGTGTGRAQRTSPWPRYRPLPERWNGPEEPIRGLLMGLGPDHVPAVHPWGSGATLLVVGPPRSGRTTYLDAAVTTSLRGQSFRCRPQSVTELEDVFSRADRGDTVLIDDADALPAPVIHRLGTLWQPGAGAIGADLVSELRLVVTLRLSDGLPSTFPPLLQWRHVVDTLLLRPRKSFDGDLFGASLSGMPVGGPPGRGYWIHRGVAELVHTPQPVG